MDSFQSSGNPRPGRKLLYVLVSAGALFLMLVLAGVYARQVYLPACEVNSVKDTSSLLLGQLKRYDHVYQFATSASADSLDYPVGTLQQILMDTQEIEVPVCMQTAHEELVSYMDNVLRAFQAYGTSEPEEKIRNLLNQSDAHYAKFKRELEAVNECAPLCFP